MTREEALRRVLRTLAERDATERELNKLKKEVESLRADVELLKMTALGRTEKPYKGFVVWRRYVGSPLVLRPIRECGEWSRGFECG